MVLMKMNERDFRNYGHSTLHAYDTCCFQVVWAARHFRSAHIFVLYIELYVYVNEMQTISCQEYFFGFRESQVN